MKPIYDVIGIGIGPFNLGLAAMIAERTDLRSLFIEKNSSFNWHPGLLLNDARLQVPYYADLVTLANLMSKFTYLNYLHQQRRMIAFGIHDQPFLLRRDYNAYCQWVTGQLNNLWFGCTCQQIHFDTSQEAFVVSLWDSTNQTGVIISICLVLNAE